jgi:Ca2+-binding EF-hand superfamily protein
MLKLRVCVFVVTVTVGAVATGTLVYSAVGQKASVPRPQDRLALGENDVKQLLVLMDTDNNGQVTRQEFMSFMEAEFQRLDKHKSGFLDVNELTQSGTRVGHFASLGK